MQGSGQALKTKRSKLAIATVVLAILAPACYGIASAMPDPEIAGEIAFIGCPSCGLFAVIVGTIALLRLKKDPTAKGENMAATGLAIGAIALFIGLLILGLLLFFAFTGAPFGGAIDPSFK